jgi:PAS domain S-box-containing protein
MSETLHQTIVEQSPDAVIVSGTDGLIRVWNRAAETLFGHAANEVVGKSLDVIIPERLREAHWRGFDKALETGVMKYAGRVLTTRSMHKDGRTLYVDLAFGLLRDEAGAVTGSIATARDCTEAYLAKKAASAAPPG